MDDYSKSIPFFNNVFVLIITNGSKVINFNSFIFAAIIAFCITTVT